MSSPWLCIVVHATSWEWRTLDSHRLCGFQLSCHAICKQRRTWLRAGGQQLGQSNFFLCFWKSYMGGQRETKKTITVAYLKKKHPPVLMQEIVLGGGSHRPTKLDDCCVLYAQVVLNNIGASIADPLANRTILYPCTQWYEAISPYFPWAVPRYERRLPLIFINRGHLIGLQATGVGVHCPLAVQVIVLNRSCRPYPSLHVSCTITG